MFPPPHSRIVDHSQHKSHFDFRYSIWYCNNYIGTLCNLYQIQYLIYIEWYNYMKNIIQKIFGFGIVPQCLTYWSQKWVPISHKNHQNYMKISFQRSKSEVTFIKNDDKLPFSMVFIGFYPTMIIISKLQNPCTCQCSFSSLLHRTILSL